MAMWDGTFGPAMKKWRWKKCRVWSPFLQCERSRRRLFLKEAYCGDFFLDWEWDHTLWLSKEEFLFAQLKGEFSNE